jgi:hypothetical protein
VGFWGSKKLQLFVWLAFVSVVTGCAVQETSETDLSRVGFPINVAVEHIEARRYEGFGGGPVLLVSFILPKALVEEAEREPGDSHSGYVIFEPAGTQQPWVATRLVLKQRWLPPRMIGIAVNWNTRYRTPPSAGATYNTAPTPARLAIVERYPCKDIRARVYVRREGWAILSKFIVPAKPSTGAPCLSRRSAEAWGIR